MINARFHVQQTGAAFLVRDSAVGDRIVCMSKARSDAETIAQVLSEHHLRVLKSKEHEMVRAKFVVKSIKFSITPGDESREVTMEPVMNGTEENRNWSKYTPSGRLQMIINNPAASSQFHEGQEWYLDFTPCEPVESE